jgi:hypothetical protein
MIKEKGMRNLMEAASQRLKRMLGLLVRSTERQESQISTAIADDCHR